MVARERSGPLTWVLIIGYLLLRIGLLGLGRLVSRMEPPVWIEPAFGLGACAIAAALVAANANSLARYNFDGLALLLFLIGYPLNTLLRCLELPFPVPGPVNLSPYYVPIAAGLAAYLVSRKTPLPKRFSCRSSWLLAGVVAGAGVGVVTGLLIRATSPGFSPVHITCPQLLLLPVYQFTYASLAEEPVFRGFLWGALRQAGLRDSHAFVIQGVLFWLAHIYYVGIYPLSFWLIVPLGAVLTGLLAWRSQSIAPSMIGHGLMNGMGQAVAFYAL